MKGVDATISGKEIRSTHPPHCPDSCLRSQHGSHSRQTPPPLLPDSGDNVTSTVYCLGILRAIITPTIAPIPATFSSIFRAATTYGHTPSNQFPTPRLPVVFPYYSYNSYLPPYCFYFKILAIDAIIVANDALVVAMDKVFCKDQLLFSFTGTITSQPGWISSRLPFFALFT